MYGKIKKETGFGTYFDKIPIKDQAAFTKLRLSNHQLIEKARHQFPKSPEAKRRCPLCPDHVEDEIHFLLHCPTFSLHKNALLSLATSTIVDFESLSDIEKFETFMTDENFAKTAAKYIRTAFKVRKFLIRLHRSIE